MSAPLSYRTTSDASRRRPVLVTGCQFPPGTARPASVQLQCPPAWLNPQTSLPQHQLRRSPSTERGAPAPSSEITHPTEGEGFLPGSGKLPGSHGAELVERKEEDHCSEPHSTPSLAQPSWSPASPGERQPPAHQGNSRQQERGKGNCFAQGCCQNAACWAMASGRRLLQVVGKSLAPIGQQQWCYGAQRGDSAALRCSHGITKKTLTKKAKPSLMAHTRCHLTKPKRTPLVWMETRRAAARALLCCLWVAAW